MSRQVRAICVPSSDGAFAAAVGAALAQSGVVKPSDLERRLRPWAPEAVVRSRELSGEVGHTWYVYRDGRFAARQDADWHRAPDTAWARFDNGTGVVLDANESLAALLRYDDESVIGRPYADLVFPEAVDLADRVYAEIVRTGRAHSVVQLRRRDGSSVAVEYLARSTGDSVEAWYRPITLAGAA